MVWIRYLRLILLKKTCYSYVLPLAVCRSLLPDTQERFRLPRGLGVGAWGQLHMGAWAGPVQG